MGAGELDYTEERPRYKRRPKGISIVNFRALRSTECDELIRRVTRVDDADPPINVSTHPDTRKLVEEKSPNNDKDYKARNHR